MPTHNPFPCSHSGMTSAPTFAGDKTILLNTGAYPGYANYLNAVCTWNGTDWTIPANVISSTGLLPVRADFSMCYDGYNVMVNGGRGQSETAGVFQDTWTFNGTTWTKEAPATVPFGRFKAETALINVAGSQRIVMFGGSNILNFLNETWLWNGSAKTWTQSAAANPPSARVDFCFSNGPTFIVLFGGKNTNSCLNDTWKFDGTTWTQLTPTTPPSVRAEAAMCYDSANTQWVLFGGRNDNNLLPPETWTLNAGGTAWTKKSPATNPPGRVGAQMSFDTVSNKVLMFGGNGLFENLADTWSWDGTNWVKL